MLKSAGELYRERFDQDFCEQSSPSGWINKALDSGCIAPIDAYFALAVTDAYQDITEGSLYFLAYLNAANRSGYTCCICLEEELYPSLVTLHRSQDEASFLLENNQELERLIQAGARQLPACLITDAKDSQLIDTAVVVMGKCFYLHKNWKDESCVIEHILSYFKQPKALCRKIPGLEMLSLMEAQKQAIINAVSYSLSFIFGGPGTGKTYTTIQCIQALNQTLFKEQKRVYIALLAPTGKAAARLKEGLHKQFSHHGKQCVVYAMTIHRFLAHSFSDSQSNKMYFPDVVVVDESSMVDLKLMAKLLKGICGVKRVICVGDPFQLPPIESGAVFKELYHFLLNSTYKQHCVELDQTLRTSKHELIDLAQQVKNQAIDNIDSNSYTQDIRFVEDTDTFDECITNYLESFVFEPNTASEFLLKQQMQGRILCVKNIGPSGSIAINRQCLHKIYHQTYNSRLVLPVIQTKNDPYTQIYNGEMGLLMIDKDQVSLQGIFHDLKEAYVILEGLDNTHPFYDRSLQVIKVPALLLPNITLAYALSIHKSQGSEYNHVLLVVEDSDSLNNEALYTAITRSKERLTIFGSLQGIKKAASITENKQSNLKQRLQSLTYVN